MCAFETIGKWNWTSLDDDCMQSISKYLKISLSSQTGLKALHENESWFVQERAKVVTFGSIFDQTAIANWIFIDFSAKKGLDYAVSHAAEELTVRFSKSTNATRVTRAAYWPIEVWNSSRGIAQNVSGQQHRVVSLPLKGVETLGVNNRPTYVIDTFLRRFLVRPHG